MRYAKFMKKKHAVEKGLENMLIFDGDYPMAFGGYFLGRDLTLPIDKVRKSKTFPGFRSSVDSTAWNAEDTMASLPEMRRAGIAGALVKIVACIYRDDPIPHGDVVNRDHAYVSGKAQLNYYRILEARGEMKSLQTNIEFADHFAVWQNSSDYSTLPVGFVLGLEGADPIHWPGQVHEWWEDGVRVISLSHYGLSNYSHGTGTGTEGGLTADGFKLLREMESAGMILDVTHTSDESVRQELEVFNGPVLASHQNARAISPGERQMPDELLKEIISRGAVIGHSMDTWMLRKVGVDWANIPSRRSVFPSSEVTLEDVADHVDHISQLSGNSLHSAIGGDTDGQGGRDGAPHDVDTVADYRKLIEVLEKRGYSVEDIKNVMFKNWQRFFEKWLPNSI